jgi:glutamate 5-kinase
VAKNGARRSEGPSDRLTNGGMNTKLHAVADADGRPIRFFMTAGQISDYMSAAVLLGNLPKVKWLLADGGL